MVEEMVAKGYTQIYGFDYYDIFSLVATMASICLLLSMVAMRSWPMYQLDIKNAFLHGNLASRMHLLLRGSLVLYAGYAVPYMA